MDMQLKVTNFISRFNSNSQDIIDVFTGDCCYWFAFILLHRFFTDGSEIMYDPVVNHFGTRIGNVVYDITGDVTDKYKWKSWYSIDDESHRYRIIRDCINF